ncbi:hypothetical protein LAJ19_21610 (plasmid) [Deinococcus taeanensis]|uniref:hypothetical protein n=1 Tax=Deinococcus taeanensis TaxID=2737050 RepID=UPI001CDD7A22|nr:hypothetical protein [Deinococcus taeanensis]UBV45523.1 hypothetical protein LAJ19_21610 [Deinococcus taeanensis]
MWTPFNPREVERVFTTESRQKDERLFTLTHTPIKRVLVTHNRVGLDSDQFIGEQHLLELLHTSAPGDANRVWFVVGETGSGKSELCQWLEYRLRDTHVPIHISRRQANLTGILDVLNAHLPPHATFVNAGLPPAMLTEHLRMFLQLRAHREGRYQSYVRDLLPWCPTLVERLYTASGAPQELLQGLPAPPADLPLTTWLYGAVREVLGVQSLESTLGVVVESYRAQGRRPVLLLEDITTLGFLRDDLMDFIFDLSAPGFDTVIGLTSGFEHSHLGGGDLNEMAYVRDRLSARFQLSHQSGETFFLNQAQDLHEMVRRYLACLPAPPHLNGAAEGFAGLYPFSPVMLDRLYLHLVESGNARQTPRNLLDAVIRPCLVMERPPHETLFRPHPYLRPPALTFYHQHLSAEQTALFYWHGIEIDGELRIPQDVARAFGHEDLPTVQTFQQPVGSPQLFQAVARADDPHAEWLAALTELQQWRRGEGFPKRQLLKKGVEKLLRVLGEPRVVTNPHLNSSTADPLEYYRGSENLPIYLPGSGDVLPEHWPSLHLPPELPAQFLEECLTFAMTPVTHVEVFADPAHTREIAEALAAQLQRHLRENLAHLLGRPVEEAVLGMWWVTQHLSLSAPILPGSEEGRRQILTYDVDMTEIKRPWQASRAHQVLSRTQAEILEQRSALRALFVSVFHHRDDLIDAPLFDRCWAAFDPVSFIESFGQFNSKRLRSAPYRQQRSRLGLHDLVRPIQEFCAALQGYGAADGDVSDWEALGLQLDDVLSHVDEYDRACRDVQHLAHQLGFAVQAPASSYQWRNAQWTKLLKEIQASSAHLLDVPPVTSISVIRAWNEYLTEIPPLKWRSGVRQFYVLVHNMLAARDGGQRLSPRQTTQQPLSVQDLLRLNERLRQSERQGEEVDPEVRRVLSTCVDRLMTLEHEELALIGAHYHQLAPKGKDEHLRVACELLDQTTRCLTEGAEPMTLT